MNKKFGLCIVLGLILGAVFGVFFGPAIGNTALATMLGAFGCVFIGWLIAAAVSKNSKRKTKASDQ